MGKSDTKEEYKKGLQKKIIKDSLQGYIYIDRIIFEKIIDTDIFQRLRRIEQTSMRCLYPAARHDRFIHSMGVYNLAKIAIAAIDNSVENNADALGDNVPEAELRKQINFCFEMAALLHDVGHAPFSHTLEEFFGIETAEDIGDGKQILIKRKRNLIDAICQETMHINEEYFKIEKNMEWQTKFYTDLCSTSAAPHELMSALIVLCYFKNAVLEIAELRKKHWRVDFELIVRCITGAQYREGVTEYKEIAYKNCIIRLMNSSIDVDKLDYISRDSSISGYDNVKIDIERLLKSMVVTTYIDSNNEERLTFAFSKNAISVIQNVVTSRNSLYTWVYAHHKIKYETYLIQQAVKRVLHRQNPEEEAAAYREYFSLDAILKKLICDADIWCLLKNRKDEELLSEIFDRRRQHKALWKSFSEFNILFAEDKAGYIGSFSADNMEEVLKNEDDTEMLKTYINGYKEGEVTFDLLVHNVKLTSIKQDSILVYLNGQVYGYDFVVKDLYHNAMCRRFFYLFCAQEKIEKIDKMDLVRYIKKYPKFNRQPKFD